MDVGFGSADLQTVLLPQQPHHSLVRTMGTRPACGPASRSRMLVEIQQLRVNLWMRRRCGRAPAAGGLALVLDSALAPLHPLAGAPFLLPTPRALPLGTVDPFLRTVAGRVREEKEGELVRGQRTRISR